MRAGIRSGIPYIGSISALDFALYAGNSEKVRIDTSGNVGIGGASGGAILQLNKATLSYLDLKSDNVLRTRIYNDSSQSILESQTPTLIFKSNSAEAMRIDSSGNLLVGKTNAGFEVQGVSITDNVTNITTDGNPGLQINRLSSDGALINFSQDTSVEGSISVSGSTVSYNGFSGNHETSGISTDTEIGTVCSTIDELDTYVSGTKSGQTRADHAKIKVSDTVGDTRVYGVLTSYSETDNKPVVASVGIGSIKVTGACSGGDLLESNGDGTAKVQSDDIVRSKTIGKVTIGNFDTGVKLVSCVLYCG